MSITHDHATLLVRYMLLMTPDEQRRLLATAPVAPAPRPRPRKEREINRDRRGGETAIQQITAREASNFGH